jgi:two-component system chemotaxis sensor kinase CheA
VENDKYLDLFLEEAADLAQSLGEALLRYERGEQPDAQIAEMFRVAHSLKGMSASMGFHNLAEAMHRMEDVLSVLRTASRPAPDAVLDALFESVDHLDAALRQIRATGAPPVLDHAAWLRVLDDAYRALQTGDAGPESPSAVDGGDGDRRGSDVPDEIRNLVAAALGSGLTVGWLTVHVDPGCQLKGARAVLVHRAVEASGEILLCDPPAERMEAGDYADVLRFLVVLYQPDSAAVIKAALSVSEVTGAEFTAWDESHGADPREGGEPGVSPGDGGQADTASQDAFRGAQAAGGPVVRDRMLRVNLDKVDALMRWCGELVVEKNRLASLLERTADDNVRAALDRLGAIAQQLQETVTSLRMVSVDGLFRRFPRMVRDLSKQLGKPLQLELAGLDTELDRTMMEDLFEILVHLVRNAADHGIEPPDVRVAAGKPETGTIRLRAYPVGQHVRVEVQDDGGGIDVEAVKRRAVERGLVEPSAAAEMSDEDAYELLFQPGFSTARQVSDISGRGVGLDAVRDTVQTLGGRIEVFSEPGRGTMFRVQLPLRRTVLTVLLARVGSQTYAVPLHSVEEALLVDRTMLRSVQGQWMLEFRGALVPVVDVGQWLHSAPACGAFPWRLIICRAGERHVALGVDKLIGQQEVVNQPNVGYLADVEWLAGFTTLGDGSIAFILDPEACLRSQLPAVSAWGEGE